MAYLPKNQYQIKHTNGGEYKLASNGKEYKGKYIATIKNKFYAGEDIRDIKGELFPLSTNNSNIINRTKVDNRVYVLLKSKDIKKQETNLHIPAFKPTPTEKEYNKGSFKRFISIRRNTGIITEISKKTYNNLLANKMYDSSLYKGFTVIWNLSNDAEEINTKSLEYYSKKVPTITDFFTDPSEFSRA